jgi:ribosomal protein S18 acetylase RimI-like enzyme
MSIKIKTPSEQDIYSFFTSLQSDELYNFTFYQDANNPVVALQLSNTILKDNSMKIFGIFNGTKMIGYGHLKFLTKDTMRHVCQFGLVVHSGNQGKGYGKMLTNHMITWAEKNGFKKIWLTVYSDNITALKLYDKLGFQIEGIFMYNEYFKNLPRHAVSMALFFDANPIAERQKLTKQISEILKKEKTEL